MNTTQQDPMSSLGLQDETVSVEIPTCIDVQPDDQGGQWTINLYADGCLDCSSLMQGGIEDYSNAPCHFSQGNQHCPAASIKMVFVGPRVVAIKRIRAAQAKNDTQAVLRQLMKLSELSEEDRAYVMRAVGINMAPPAPEMSEPEETVNTEVGSTEVEAEVDDDIQESESEESVEGESDEGEEASEIDC